MVLAVYLHTSSAYPDMSFRKFLVKWLTIRSLHSLSGKVMETAFVVLAG